jgi:hypothetical protein
MGDESFCHFCCINVRHFLPTVLILYRSAQVSLTPHEAEIRLVLPGALPRFTQENQTFFERSKIRPRIFRIEFLFSTI